MANSLLTSAQICAEALTWVGTPFHNHACVKGIGVDCAMLLVGIARNLSLVAPDWTPDFYPPQWHLHQNEERYCAILESQGAMQRPLGTQQPGHILLFRWRATQPASHAAIAMPDEMIIHAFMARNPRDARVRHEPFSAYYARHLAYVYAWPGVTHE